MFWLDDDYGWFVSRWTTPKLAQQKKPLTPAQFDQHLLIGLMSQLPDTAADFDDPDDEPIAIEGEPLSETVIRQAPLRWRITSSIPATCQTPCERNRQPRVKSLVRAKPATGFNILATCP